MTRKTTSLLSPTPKLPNNPVPVRNFLLLLMGNLFVATTTTLALAKLHGSGHVRVEVKIPMSLSSSSLVQGGNHSKTKIDDTSHSTLPSLSKECHKILSDTLRGSFNFVHDPKNVFLKEVVHHSVFDPANNKIKGAGRVDGDANKSVEFIESKLQHRPLWAGGERAESDRFQSLVYLGAASFECHWCFENKSSNLSVSPLTMIQLANSDLHIKFEKALFGQLKMRECADLDGMESVSVTFAPSEWYGSGIDGDDSQEETKKRQKLYSAHGVAHYVVTMSGLGSTLLTPECSRVVENNLMIAYNNRHDPNQVFMEYSTILAADIEDEPNGFHGSYSHKQHPLVGWPSNWYNYWPLYTGFGSAGYTCHWCQPTNDPPFPPLAMVQLGDTNLHSQFERDLFDMLKACEDCPVLANLEYISVTFVVPGESVGDLEASDSNDEEQQQSEDNLSTPKNIAHFLVDMSGVDRPMLTEKCNGILEEELKNTYNRIHDRAEVFIEMTVIISIDIPSAAAHHPLGGESSSWPISSHYGKAEFTCEWCPDKKDDHIPALSKIQLMDAETHFNFEIALLGKLKKSVCAAFAALTNINVAFLTPADPPTSSITASRNDTKEKPVTLDGKNDHHQIGRDTFGSEHVVITITGKNTAVVLDDRCRVTLEEELQNAYNEVYDSNKIEIQGTYIIPSSDADELKAPNVAPPSLLTKSQNSGNIGSFAKSYFGEVDWSCNWCSENTREKKNFVAMSPVLMFQLLNTDLHVEFEHRLYEKLQNTSSCDTLSDKNSNLNSITIAFLSLEDLNLSLPLRMPILTR